MESIGDEWTGSIQVSLYNESKNIDQVQKKKLQYDVLLKSTYLKNQPLKIKYQK
jgi:hypothetical protein